MNFSTPPSMADIKSLAQDILEQCPDELVEFIQDLEIFLEEFPDAGLLDDLDLEDEFELPVLYFGGDSLKQNMVFKGNVDENTLTLFRRPILDMWCETEEDLMTLIRHLIFMDIAENHGFDEGDIKAMLDHSEQEIFAA